MLYTIHITGAISSNAALFGRGSGPIFLDQSMCIGNESRLIDCQSTGAGVHECNHLQDAGVHCQGLCRYLYYLRKPFPSDNPTCSGAL